MAFVPASPVCSGSAFTGVLLPLSTTCPLQRLHHRWPPSSIWSTLPPQATASRPGRTATASVERMLSKLREDLPVIFTTESPDYSLYAKDVTFEDPLTRFRGTRPYARNIAFLSRSPVFRDASLLLHDSRILPPPRDTVIRTRWTLRMVVAFLPWRPVVAFTGQSDYHVGVGVGAEAEGRVTRHVDYWDALRNNAYFSTEALAHLFAQCAKTDGLARTQVPEYTLLRKNKALEVWQFTREVRVAPVQSQDEGATPLAAVYGATTKSRDEDGGDGIDVGRYVAVVNLGMRPPLQGDVEAAEHAVRAALKGATYAETDEKGGVWCMRAQGRGEQRGVYCLWVQLKDANAFVGLD